MTKDVELTIWQHLDELRARLIKAAIALVVGTAVGLVFCTQVLQILLRPLPRPPQALQPSENIGVYFQIALVLGLVLAMPIIVYQVVRYMVPGLEPAEKKYLYWLLPAVFVSFGSGVAFAVFIMLPAAINFLQGFLSNLVENRWSLRYYVAFVTNAMFWIGIVFEMPLIIFFLTKLGLITPKKLTRFRKFAIVLNAVVAAMVTPTPDPVNMMIVMLPLLALYELGVLLSRLAMAGKKEEALAT